MKLPSLIPAIAADLARGDCAVVQLVSTSEAMLDRALADLSPEERAWLDIELSPREFLVDYLTAAFPVRQMRTYTEIGRAHVCTPVTNAHLVCRLLLETKTIQTQT